MQNNPFNPNMIGKILVIQVFDRKKDNPDELDTTTLRKYVGKLQAYHYDTSEKPMYHRGTFALEGGLPAFAYHDEDYVEVHPC